MLTTLLISLYSPSSVLHMVEFYFTIMKTKKRWKILTYPIMARRFHIADVRVEIYHSIDTETSVIMTNNLCAIALNWVHLENIASINGHTTQRHSVKRSKLSLNKKKQVIHRILNDMEKFSAMKHYRVHRVLSASMKINVDIYFDALLSKGFEYDCPCNERNCTEMMMNFSSETISYC